MFNDIIEQAKNMSVDERVELLEHSKELAQLHASAATEGQTAVWFPSCRCVNDDSLFDNRLLVAMIPLIFTLSALSR